MIPKSYKWMSLKSFGGAAAGLVVALLIRPLADPQLEVGDVCPTEVRGARSGLVEHAGVHEQTVEEPVYLPGAHVPASTVQTGSLIQRPSDTSRTPSATMGLGSTAT